MQHFPPNTTTKTIYNDTTKTIYNDASFIDVFLKVSTFSIIYNIPWRLVQIQLIMALYRGKTEHLFYGIF